MKNTAQCPDCGHQVETFRRLHSFGDGTSIRLSHYRVHLPNGATVAGRRTVDCCASSNQTVEVGR